MAVEVIMPKAGMAMEEGTIVKWYKKEGDFVQEGEPLLEIITDKVNMEVEAETSGTLIKIMGQEGEILPVFQVIAYIGAEGEILEGLEEGPSSIQIDQAQEGKVLEKEQQPEGASESSLDDKLRATPAARFEAKQRNIPLEHVQGTGPNQRIQKQDVMAYRERPASPLARKMMKEEGFDISTIQGTGHGGKIMARDLAMQQGKGAGTKFYPEASSFVDYAMNPIERTVARRMSESYFTSPTFSLQTEVDMKLAKEALVQLKEKILLKAGAKPTMTDLIVLAVSKALEEHPALNASMVEDQIRIYGQNHIAIAVGTEKGLMVPVLKNVQSLTLSQIAAQRKKLAEKASQGSLQQEEIEGSTFTISNLGMYGISAFTSIINQPNAAILSVGAIKDQVVALEGNMAIRPMMNLTLTIDHRIVDGVKGAKFLQALRENLEKPLNMLV